ncbi:MAG: HesA/MoeB/ThiF family protein, partial [Candidatus Bathyarchaeia archaeon]
MADAPEELTEEELDAYSRQIVLTDIGYEGQLKLKNSKVAIVGLGGLGSISSMKLAAMGVGYLRIIDRDIVSMSDLHRQHLYDMSLVGYPKAEAAYRKLRVLNPRISIEPIANSLNTLNAIELINGVNVVIDGLDAIETRYLLNRACQKLKIPYIFGSAIEAFGNVSTIIPEETACLECFYHGLKDEVLPKCGTIGVHPSI